jgi:hypothetical protein
MENFVCESCGAPTTGDAICANCLQRLRDAAYARPTDRVPTDLSLPRAIHVRVASVIAGRALSLASEFRDGAMASTEIVTAVETLLDMVRGGAPHTELAAMLEQLAVAVREWNEHARKLLDRLELHARDALAGELVEDVAGSVDRRHSSELVLQTRSNTEPKS